MPRAVKKYYIAQNKFPKSFFSEILGLIGGSLSDNYQITKRTGVISFFTLISRFSGLARDAVVAFFFGTSLAADAFYMAFTIPNLLRRFVAEGALTIAFIPIFSAEKKRSEEGAKALFNAAVSYQLTFLIFITALGIVVAPWLVRVIAAGFESDPVKFQLTIDLTRAIFPYIILVSLAALVMGVLNSCKKFAASAYAPVFLNIGLILGAVFSQQFDPPIYGLVFGVLLGGLMHLAVQLPDLLRLGYRPRITFAPHPELKALLGLMLPAAYGAAVYQINVIVIRFFASYLPEGAVSYLWYGNRLYEFPIGVFAIALATAIQPSLADFAAEKDWEKFKQTLHYGIRLSLYIAVPAMVGLAVLAHPIVRILLERGAFDAAATTGTATVLIAFAVGLPFLAIVRLLVPAFFALKESKKPVTFATVTVAINIAVSWALIGPYQYAGLAMAISISSVVNAFLLLIALRRKLGLLGLKKVALSGLKTILASGLMGGCLLYVVHYGHWLRVDHSKWIQLGELTLAVIGGGIFYFFVTRLLGCQEATELWGLFKRKSRRSLF